MASNRISDRWISELVFGRNVVCDLAPFPPNPVIAPLVAVHFFTVIQAVRLGSNYGQILFPQKVLDQLWGPLHVFPLFSTSLLRNSHANH